jgi:hypothetical protein
MGYIEDDDLGKSSINLRNAYYDRETRGSH